MGIETSDLTSLARYVPRISAEWKLTTSEPWQEIEGTLCYIDISGFTALSEKLARRGRIGAEELTEVLNYVFGKMLTVAYDRGGSLLKFGGDALLLRFTGFNHPTQAASAAVEMQAALREARSYETSAGRLSLKMSVGLHTGTVHLFRVGESHKELILTGPAASTTTEMEETAVAGEVLVSSATKSSLLDGGADGSKGEGWLLKWRKARIERCGWVPRAQLDPEAIGEGMPVALREFLRHGIAEPGHRIATVGFIKFQGVDALMEQGGPPAAAEALDQLVRNVQQAVDEEGVTFLASDIDQDGGKIIIVAGVPSVQEDDEGRVLRAARRIADNAGILELRIGVNQGHVFVGEVGTDIRATYTIMGDTVNLAARLMGAASPGEVYASPTALERSSTLFETTPLEPFHVKGKEQPVQAYSVGAMTGRRGSKRGDVLPFVGRVDELAKLHAMVDDLFAGKGKAVAITGERGVGKSRIVDEILPALEKAVHIDIRAEPYGIGTPYRPLRGPVRRLLGIRRGEQQQMAQDLQDAIDVLIPDRASLAPLVADVTMIDIPSTPEVDQIDPKFRQDRTADLLMELFGIVCDGPVFFEVEDGHYMDEASSHVMKRLAQATEEQPWLVLTTRRDESGGFDPGGVEIELAPLSDDEARQLILDATAAAPLRPHDVDAIVQRAGGLPLFLVEIIGAVRAAGEVGTLPESLDAVVSAQIDALPPLARRLLRFASVLGRSFRVSILNQLLEEEGIRLDTATRPALADFLDPDEGDRLRFRHGMIRDVAYGGLSFKRRRELHLRAAENFERADSPESVADLLSLHYSIAGVAEKAWNYSRIAGSQAQAAYANVDAASYYVRALESAKRLDSVTDSERAEVWTDLGDVRGQAGLFESAVEAYRRASKLVGGDPIRRGELLLRRAAVRERAGDYVTALKETTRVRRLLGDVDEHEATRLRARASAFYAYVRQHQDKPREALERARKAIEEAEAANDKAAMARAYNVTAWASLMLDESGAGDLWRKALGLYEEIEDHAGQADVTNNLGGLAYFEGNWDQALDFYRRSRSESERLGSVGDVGFVDMNIGEVLTNQGNLDDAERVLRDAWRILRSIGWNHGAFDAGMFLGRALAMKGDLDEAHEILTRVRREAIEAGSYITAFESALYLAECLIAEGDSLGALSLLDEAREGVGEEASIYASTEARVRATALLDLSRMEEAIRLVDRGLAEARDRGLDFEVGLLMELADKVGSVGSARRTEPPVDEAAGTLEHLGVDS